MNFWNKIFGIENVSKNNLSTAKQINEDWSINNEESDNKKEIVQRENSILKDKSDIKSKISSKDYSIWLIDKFRNKDYESIWTFVKETFGDDENAGSLIDFSGIMEETIPSVLSKKYGITLNEAKKIYSKLNDEIEAKNNSKVQKSWRRISFENFISKDLSIYIKNNEDVIFEIQSFFILFSGLDDNMRGFWIGEGGVSESLSKILCVHSFTIDIETFDTLILKGNSFLKEMKKEEKKDGYLGGWNEIPNFKRKELKLSYSVDTKTDILKKLQCLGLAERLHFFDYASSNAFAKYWSGLSTSKSRKAGLCEEESVKKMVELELFEYTNDIESIPYICSKKELKESAEDNGFEIKKTWTLQKIYENILTMDDGKVFLQNLVNEKKGLKFNYSYINDLHLIIEYQEQLRIISELLSMV